MNVNKQLLDVLKEIREFNLTFTLSPTIGELCNKAIAAAEQAQQSNRECNEIEKIQVMTKEQLEYLRQMRFSQSCGSLSLSSDEIIAHIDWQAARIANLEAKRAEPVVYGRTLYEKECREMADKYDVKVALEAARNSRTAKQQTEQAQQPAVPELSESARVPDDFSGHAASVYRAGWNDCRAAMLATAQKGE